MRVPEADHRLTHEVVAFVQQLREIDFFKAPGVAESIDWLRALTTLAQPSLDPAVVDQTLGVLLKYQDDIEKARDGETRRILADVEAGMTAVAG